MRARLFSALSPVSFTSNATTSSLWSTGTFWSFMAARRWMRVHTNWIQVGDTLTGICPQPFFIRETSIALNYYLMNGEDKLMDIEVRDFLPHNSIKFSKFQSQFDWILLELAFAIGWLMKLIVLSLIVFFLLFLFFTKVIIISVHSPKCSFEMTILWSCL